MDYLLVIITAKGTWYYTVQSDREISDIARAFDGSSEARVFNAPYRRTNAALFIGQLREATTHAPVVA